MGPHLGCASGRLPGLPGRGRDRGGRGRRASERDVQVSAAAADEIATWLQSRLELATFSTEALSGPLEDGSFVLDSVGDEDCRIETTVAPAGGLTIITVRYGADCPFE